MSNETANEIRERLRRFLEVHNGTKIPEALEGALKMHMAHCRANKKTKKKDIIINFLLERMEFHIFDRNKLKENRNEIILDFLMTELEEFYRNTLKR